MQHLTLCADAKFVIPLAVTLRSLAVSQPVPHDVTITILSLGIPVDDQARLAESAAPLHCDFVPIEQQIPESAPEVAHLSRATYGRLMAVDILPPGADRALYLDSDLIVRDDLSSLFAIDLAGAPVGAVQSVIVPHVSNPLGLRQWKSLGFSPTTPYLNSGVLVIDTRAWRARGLGSEVLAFVLEHRDEIALADQDGLNGVLGGDFARLPLRWNQEHVLRTPLHFGYSFFGREEVEEAVNDPAIIHFTGPDKPWRRGCVDQALPDWFRLLAQTPYRNFEIPRKSNRQRAVERLGKLLRI
jgi:lipopolysaccharide biosynthesis glycosyltransferase